jgi:hypothetical protein
VNPGRSTPGSKIQDFKLSDKVVVPEPVKLTSANLSGDFGQKGQLGLGHLLASQWA